MWFHILPVLQFVLEEPLAPHSIRTLLEINASNLSLAKFCEWSWARREFGSVSIVLACLEQKLDTITISVKGLGFVLDMFKNIKWQLFL